MNIKHAFVFNSFNSSFCFIVTDSKILSSELNFSTVELFIILIFSFCFTFSISTLSPRRSSALFIIVTVLHISGWSAQMEWEAGSFLIICYMKFRLWEHREKDLELVEKGIFDSQLSVHQKIQKKRQKDLLSCLQNEKRSAGYVRCRKWCCINKVGTLQKSYDNEFKHRL